MSQQSLSLHARGLYTFPNNLSEIPEGSLVVADNVIIDRNGVIEPRRGLVQYGETFGIGTDRIKQLMTYKQRILRHYDTTIEYDDGTGNFTAFSGSYSEQTSGYKIRFLESNGNFYFTTSKGIKKISATSSSQFTGSAGYIRDSGAPRGLDVSGTVNYTTTGFLTDSSKVAYRIVWGYKDTNSNLILGFPSAPVEITNFSSTDSGTVNLQFSIPNQITSSTPEYFYQIYRTAVIQGTPLSDISAGDEMNLIVEDFPSSAELTARVVSVNDVTPESFRVNGTLLYTNAISGAGIDQGNAQAPIAQDIALFQNSVFYANTQTIQRLELDVLSVSQLTTGTSTMSVTDGTTTNTYTFVGVAEKTRFTTVANTADALNNLYFYINSANDERKYYVWFNSSGGGTDPAPDATRIGIEVAISTGNNANTVASTLKAVLDAMDDFNATVSTNQVTVTNQENGATTNATAQSSGFTVAVLVSGDGENAATKQILISNALTPAQQIDITARSIVRVLNETSTELVNAYYISSSVTVPGLLSLESRDISNSAFWVYANSTNTGSQFSPTLPHSSIDESVISTNEVEPNAIYFSKFQQPEAVPLVNKFNVGPKDKAILRILALRNGLFILKEDGIYRLTGTNGNFQVDPFDNSANLNAPNSAAILNNQIYMFSSQGVVTITDTGVNVISRPIEDQLRLVTAPGSTFSTNSFGVSYESDRAYLLWTVTTVDDTIPTQCFRYNTFTNAWTRFPISKTAGIVNSANDKLYVGAGDENFIEIERKSYNRKDYADREISLNIDPGAIGNLQVVFANTSNIIVGDALVQEQYLTIYQFNQLLKKLDLDPGLQNDDYFSTLAAVAGDDLRNKLNDLAIHLDIDPGLTAPNFLASLGGGPTFANFQTDFNIISDLLIANIGTKFKNYRHSTGTQEVEVLISNIQQHRHLVDVMFNVPFIQGPIVLYQGINAKVTWAPQPFGDPSTWKQVSTGTYLFENTVFFGAKAAYSSDLSPGFEVINFDKLGIGDWGLFIWDQQNWGGGADSTPLRTYIPRNKQRCRFLNCQFIHTFSREKFSLFGVSLSFRVISDRAYRG